MAFLIRKTGFFFGAMEHPPRIPGYAIIARDRHWLTARNLAGQEFLPEQTAFGWLLHPIAGRSSGKTSIDQAASVVVVNLALKAAT